MLNRFFSLSCINTTNRNKSRLQCIHRFVLTCKNETRYIHTQVIVLNFRDTHGLTYSGGILLSIDRSIDHFFKSIWTDLIKISIIRKKRTHTDMDWNKSGMEWNEMQFFSVWSPWNLCRKCCCCFVESFFSIFLFNLNTTWNTFQLCIQRCRTLFMRCQCWCESTFFQFVLFLALVSENMF